MIEVVTRQGVRKVCNDCAAQQRQGIGSMTGKNERPTVACRSVKGQHRCDVCGKVEGDA